MFWFYLTLFFQQEFYYLDGVEIHLVNGTIIKTASKLREDLYFYSWEEGEVTVNIEKNHIESIRFFSMRVPGRAPIKKTKTAAQRRLTGKPIAYSHGGKTYFKSRHVDRTGRSADGKKVPNRVKEMILQVDEEQDQRLILVSFSETTPETRTVFRFYDLGGHRIYETFLAMRPQKKRGKDGAPYQIALPEGVVPEKVGLIEVTTQSQ